MRNVNNHFEHLQKIPFESSYISIKNGLPRFFKDYAENGNYVEGINFVIFGVLDDEMDENGLQKAGNNIVSALFLVKHDIPDEPIFYDAYCDILDIETGEYDYLMSSEDLEELKVDIKIINDYLDKHPHLREK